VKVRFLEIAELELDQAIRWYGAQAPGLGDAFLIEVLSAADRISRFPEAWIRWAKAYDGAASAASRTD
jgi:toxin ParE2